MTNAIDRSQDVAHRAAARLTVFQEHRAKRRTERQGVERRDQHRYRDGHCELAEKLPADAGNEGDRNENRQQDERDGEDGAGHFGHRLLAGLRHRQLRLLLHHPLDVLDHDDGVIDHDADREHQGEQGDGVG